MLQVESYHTVLKLPGTTEKQFAKSVKAPAKSELIFQFEDTNASLSTLPGISQFFLQHLDTKNGKWLKKLIWKVTDVPA